MNDIVGVAANAGQFNTLVAAVKAAGLAETLQGAGPFTVFAPTDAAFGKLPEGTIEALLADKEKLTAILTYHVVSGKVMAADIVQAGGADPATVNGAPVNITLRDGQVYVDGAKVVTADIQASNGVIHVIDTVIMPSMATASAGN
ncbi:MAG: fasciclin domain-containing protein [Gemmatimonadaceae bacterium]